MRTPNLGTAFYAPTQPPDDIKQLARYIYEENIKIAAAVNALAAGHYDKQTVEPPKPRDGDVRYADGVGWLPNGVGGVGIWYYNSGIPAWVQLG